MNLLEKGWRSSGASNSKKS